MGYVVTLKSIATDPEKVKAIKKFPEPHDLTTLRSFLGCAGYYRQFIPNFADIVSPLYGHKRKGANFKLATDCLSAFDTLKKRLTSFFNFGLPQLRSIIYPGYRRQQHRARSCDFTSTKRKGTSYWLRRR